jgi:Uma2 family endonuclease
MSVVIDQQPPAPRLKRWTKQEYNDLVERGAFRGQHVYLFRGELIEMSPQYHPHAFAVTKLNSALLRAFGLDAGFECRIQLPFDVPGETMPEPDALVCTVEQNLRIPHPNQALLVVEVSDSSLAGDREKALEYAAAGVPEYWIVDVSRRLVEVYRNPAADATTPLGFQYGRPALLEANATIEPLAKPGAVIAIAQFFH